MLSCLFCYCLATEVHFDNTPVPVGNVLGEAGAGFKVCVRFYFLHLLLEVWVSYLWHYMSLSRFG